MRNVECHSTFNIQHSTFPVLPELQMTELTVLPPDFAEQRATLEKTWSRKRGIVGWLSETGHKEIGIRYIVTAFVFFALGGLEAALMRIQLSKPENHFLNPDQYNQIFTMHGTTI